MRHAAGRLALLILILGCCSFVRPGNRVHAQQPAAGAQSPAGAGGWTFDDEKEDVPSWQQILRGQAIEIASFAAFATLALVGFFRKDDRITVATLVASVAYLGVYRSELISIVNVFGLVQLNLPIFQYNLGWYLFAGFTLASTVLWGRLYCGRICAFGSMTQLLDRVVPARLRVEVPVRIERKAAYIKYGVLLGAVAYFLATREMAFFKYIEPFWMFTGRATWPLWAGLGTLLLATVFVRNLYCRFLCPVGAFLGLLSNLTVFRIKRWSECKSCKICEKTCEWGAIRGPKIVASECVRCDDCERLYMDQQKCPHWLILIRKSGSRLPASGSSQKP